MSKTSKFALGLSIVLTISTVAGVHIKQNWDRKVKTLALLTLTLAIRAPCLYDDALCIHSCLPVLCSMHVIKRCKDVLDNVF